MRRVEVVVAEEATPVARVMAGRLKAAVSRRRITALVGRMKGSFSVRSATDPQHVTVAIKSGLVTVTPGLAKGAGLVVETDFGKQDDADYRPRFHGWWRRPLFALRVGRLLAEPLLDWEESAKRFWAASAGLPDMPERLIVKCRSDDRSLSLGKGENEGIDEGAGTAELVGDARQLTKLFMGHQLLIEAIIRNKLKAKASMRHIAGISNAGLDLLMGETTGETTCGTTGEASG